MFSLKEMLLLIMGTALALAISIWTVSCGDDDPAPAADAAITETMPQEAAVTETAPQEASITEAAPKEAAVVDQGEEPKDGPDPE